MAGKISTHVLDTTIGKPGAGVRLELFVRQGDTRRLIKTAQTNADGRTDEPLLLGDAMQVGIYELDFYAGDYFRARGVQLSSPAFVEVVTLRFGVADADANYHVPLVCTPWSYSTYRGS